APPSRPRTRSTNGRRGADGRVRGPLRAAAGCPARGRGRAVRDVLCAVFVRSTVLVSTVFSRTPSWVWLPVGSPCAGPGGPVVTAPVSAPRPAAGPTLRGGWRQSPVRWGVRLPG